jgi:hypothetical protein
LCHEAGHETLRKIAYSIFFLRCLEEALREGRLRKEPASYTLRNIELQDLNLSLLILIKYMTARLDSTNDPSTP